VSAPAAAIAWFTSLGALYEGWPVPMMSEAEILGIKAAPTWPARVAAAHTESPDEIKADPQIVAAALPDAGIHVLDGQMPMAHLTDPQSFVDAIMAFLRD
jgi:hypothetical protein